ncbi:uncharacterized protein B0H18DRAFT_1021284 [Fomitopsis serialis]|uniref:uncharacterized protein n=1 Tax=Fomitopsis serialis TaxID=139415 RepID=UPI0020079A39|nr:uncharacterized protein B0H18DRAFT_1021284 [Neoantrodia serialis]KAH9921294.1 hypothetical protein B0H18DRAFT_1021284 [Neoantrodia serialis]
MTSSLNCTSTMRESSSSSRQVTSRKACQLAGASNRDIRVPMRSSWSVPITSHHSTTRGRLAIASSTWAYQWCPRQSGCSSRALPMLSWYSRGRGDREGDVEHELALERGVRTRICIVQDNRRFARVCALQSRALSLARTDHLGWRRRTGDGTQRRTGGASTWTRHRSRTDPGEESNGAAERRGCGRRGRLSTVMIAFWYACWGRH